MECTHTPGVECVGPIGESKRWQCPVHGVYLTKGWTKLCRSNPAYFEAWKAGHGPGQNHTTPASKVKPKGGPGTELKKIIAAWQKRFPWFDLQPGKGCGCDAAAKQMDQWGCDKCVEKMDVIVARLEKEAIKRKLSIPFRKTAARLLVLQAIRRSRK